MTDIRGAGTSESRAGVAEAFARYLADRGYGRSSIRKRLQLLADVDRWMRIQGLGWHRFDDAAAKRFLVERLATHRTLSGSRALGPLLDFLRSAGLIPQADEPTPGTGLVEKILEGWSVYLERERGLEPETIGYYLRWGRPFLQSRLASGNRNVANLTAGDVCVFIGQRIPDLRPAAAHRTLTSVRSLLKFLYVSGQIPQRLDAVIPTMAQHRSSGLPRWLSPGQVTALIRACDPSTPLGRRDQAVILIMARLGLRAGETAALSLDDIDWRSGTIRIRGKGGYRDTMPLPTDVGETLAAHLAAIRPPTATARALFLRSRAPFVPLSPAGLGAVVGQAARRAGLGTVGPHRLRHSVATATVNAGASLEETGQLLRHRTLTSTTTYAKVDLARLRTVARVWPDAPAGRSSNLGAHDDNA